METWDLMGGDDSTWTISRNLDMKQSEGNDHGNSKYETNEYLELTRELVIV